MTQIFKILRNSCERKKPHLSWFSTALIIKIIKCSCIIKVLEIANFYTKIIIVHVLKYYCYNILTINTWSKNAVDKYISKLTSPEMGRQGSRRCHAKFMWLDGMLNAYCYCSRLHLGLGPSIQDYSRFHTWKTWTMSQSLGLTPNLVTWLRYRASAAWHACDICVFIYESSWWH